MCDVGGVTGTLVPFSGPEAPRLEAFKSQLASVGFSTFFLFGLLLSFYHRFFSGFLPAQLVQGPQLVVESSNNTFSYPTAGHGGMSGGNYYGGP